MFVLDVLCAFAARPVEYRLDHDRVVRQKRYSTGLAPWSKALGVILGLR
ncbi:MAG: hypothetical protein O6837_09885 [Deltaproteobacteria bacterium]|nr:hypothetical protein [Deltaproteobacteria bacterium]